MASAEMPHKSKANLSSHWLRIRGIMGRNFFGVEEAIKHFGVNPSAEQLAALSEIPFSEARLREVKDTHVLVAVVPLSILDIRGKVERKLFFKHEDAWYNEESFAKERGEAGWQLVPKTPVDSEKHTAQVMVYAIIGHYCATGERLFEHAYVRTSSMNSRGYLERVGYFTASDGLHIPITGMGTVLSTPAIRLPDSPKS
ncbi:MAG: hypothetical protein WC740_01815 [Verrucomicrobiia bacterium]